MTGFFRQNGAVVGGYILLSVVVWLGLLLLVPQIIMLDFSFRFDPWSERGQADPSAYTLENYDYLIFGSAQDSYNATDLSALVRSLIVAGVVTALDLAICYPIAYILAKSATGWQARLLLLALILPYWVNELLRAFAFRIVFDSSGLLNEAALFMGLWDSPVDFKQNYIALYTGLSYSYILLMVFPLYNAIESLDRNQIEAARDMGASWISVHRRIVIPFAKPGIASGCTMVFMLTAGALATPQILRGTSGIWFTEQIHHWFNAGSNWSMGAAYAVVLLITCVITVLLAMRVFGVKLREIGGEGAR